MYILEDKMKKNLLQKWFEDISLEEIEVKVNNFTQTDKRNVVATQTHTLELNGVIYYQAVVFYENN
jgi:hypothetical protein